MYLKAIILAGIVLCGTAYVVIKDLKEKGINYIKALIGIAIALVFLSYPLYTEYVGITRVACSILFAIQALTLDQDFELIHIVEPTSLTNDIYIVLTYALYFISPFLSASTIISIFGYTFSRLRFLISLKSEYHIFSEINERTIATSNVILATNKNARIVFANKDNGEDLLIKNKKILVMKEKINDLKLSKIKKEKYLYFISNNEEDNLNDSLEFLDKAKNTDKAKIYILNSKTEAYMIIDSMMSANSEKSKNIQVEIINEAERIVLQRLKELPIEKVFDTIKKQVTVLIVGCGEYGESFLKAISWCFQVIGYSLKIIVVEQNAETVQNKINFEAPELLKKYDIEFIDKPIEVVISENLLKNININYAVVTAGADSNNFNIAVALRRYFLVNNLDDVMIDIIIKNTYKSKNIEILKDDTNKAYKFNTLGSIEETYLKNPIINSDIEKMAQRLHNINVSGKPDGNNSYNSEYNRKSSRASVVHIKYKLFAVLQDKYTGNLEIDLQNYKKIIKNPETIDLLAKNEHDRWMSYMYTDGYKVATMEALEKYYLKVGSKHKHSLARLHPALVENEKLPVIQEQVDSVIEKLTGTKSNCNFIEQDKDIVQKFDIIMDIGT